MSGTGYTDKTLITRLHDPHARGAELGHRPQEVLEGRRLGLAVGGEVIFTHPCTPVYLIRDSIHERSRAA
jgi:hypothetical protein